MEEEEDYKTTEDLLVEQYFVEVNNSMFYAHFATKFSKMDLMGMTAFFKAQSLEEYTHSQKILEHLIENSIALDYTMFIPLKISVVNDFLGESDFSKSVMELSLVREQENSSRFNELMRVAEKDEEYKHYDILEWFIREQLEEEKTFNTLLKKLGVNRGVYDLDREFTIRYNKK
jgi:ferritin